jgi:hypothetical protein
MMKARNFYHAEYGDFCEKNRIARMFSSLNVAIFSGLFAAVFVLRNLCELGGKRFLNSWS